MTEYITQPSRPVRTARNAPTVRYYVVESTLDGNVECYMLRRDIHGRSEYWTGSFYGWMEMFAGNVAPKRYKHFGAAKRSLQLIQEQDRGVLTSRGRKRLTENLAPQLASTLRELMDYVGGWDQPASHPCGKAAALLRIIERGY